MVRSGSLLLLLVASLLAAPRGAGAREATAATKAPASTTKSKRELDALRKRCYGGRGEKAPPPVSSLWDHNALEAAAKGDNERLAYWTRRLLQGHGDELKLLPSFIIAAAHGEEEFSDEALDACNELYVSLPRPKAE